jgi:DNA mismatch repair protein MSH2
VKPILTEKGSSGLPVSVNYGLYIGLGTGDVILKGARHPCLEVQDDIDFIANDHIMHKGNFIYIVSTVY